MYSTRCSAIGRKLNDEPAPALLGLIAQLSVLGVGSWLIMRGDGFTVGDLVAFQVLLAGFTAPVHALFAHTQKLQTLRGDLARLDDVLHHAAEDGIDLVLDVFPVAIFVAIQPVLVEVLRAVCVVHKRGTSKARRLAQLGIAVNNCMEYRIAKVILNLFNDLVA